MSCAPGTEWVDPEDPTVIAENELLGAAAAIEAAAKKLEQLRPRTKPKVREAFLTAPQAFTLSPLTLRRGHMLRVVRCVGTTWIIFATQSTPLS